MGKFKLDTKTICIFGMALALYVVISNFCHIPIGIGHLWIDMGYVVYGIMLTIYGIPAVIVGVLGVFLENLLFTGWISYSWMAGQVIIGICCGLAYKDCYKYVAIIMTIISVWFGIGFVKTIIEVQLGYGIMQTKLVTNGIASVLDMIPLLIGYFIAKSGRIDLIMKNQL